MVVPRDIIIDVLLKLPAKSLLRFKCVCKSWRSVIEDAEFIDVHHDRCKNRQKFLVCCKKDDHHYVYYSLDAPVEHNPVVNVIPGINYDQLSSRVCISSCNGILILVFPYDEVILWNPTTRESRKIPSPIVKRRDRRRFTALYGFGYVSSMDDYKIVRIGQKHFSCNYDVEIFWTKRSKSWELIGHVAEANFHDRMSIVVVDGVVYIAAIMNNNNRVNVSITRFGLEKGEYETLLFPDRITYVEDPRFYVLGENVCLTRLRGEFPPLYFEVWLMKKNASWSRIMIELVDHTSYYSLGCWMPVSFTKNGDLLLLRYGTEFVVYNSTNHKFEQVEVTGLEPSLSINWIVPYAHSLFSPH